MVNGMEEGGDRGLAPMVTQKASHTRIAVIFIELIHLLRRRACLHKDTVSLQAGLLITRDWEQGQFCSHGVEHV
jgi:hypothetical protein